MFVQHASKKVTVRQMSVMFGKCRHMEFMDTTPQITAMLHTVVVVGCAKDGTIIVPTWTPTLSGLAARISLKPSHNSCKLPLLQSTAKTDFMRRSNINPTVILKSPIPRLGNTQSKSKSVDIQKIYLGL